MTRLSLWNSGVKGKDYTFIDRTISEYVGISGTCVYVHLYIGPHQQLTPMMNADGTIVPALDPDNPPSSPIVGGLTTIQDVLLLENRDRKYSDTVYELRGCYNMADIDYDLRQFGLFLTGNTLFLEFHLNDMMSMLGRRILSGDVLELPHRRDDTIDLNSPAINSFYVVDEASRPASGYSQTWWPHLWRVKLTPMTASQEFQDILNKQQTNPIGEADPGTIGSLMTTIGFDMGIDEAVVAQAKLSVSKRYFETQQYYIVLPETNDPGYPWVFAGDGIPPNGARPISTGRVFPENPQEGDYVLRTDYSPATLFLWTRGLWKMQEQDHRGNDWSAAHGILLSFINNNKVSTFQDNTTAPEKQPLSKAIKPKADF